jgi:hypothetical protein
MAWCASLCVVFLEPHLLKHFILFFFQARRSALMLKYVQEADPKDADKFVQSAPPSVVAAFRQTVSNMVGTLPATYFEVKVSTVGHKSGKTGVLLFST